jgi:hypothetical protein
LTGGVRRRQQANDKSFSCPEPAPGDIGGQEPADKASGQADDDTPQQNELPGLCKRRSENPSLKRPGSPVAPE